jgi:hypothetical protein
MINFWLSSSRHPFVSSFSVAKKISSSSFARRILKVQQQHQGLVPVKAFGNELLRNTNTSRGHEYNSVSVDRGLTKISMAQNSLELEAQTIEDMVSSFIIIIFIIIYNLLSQVRL